MVRVMEDLALSMFFNVISFAIVMIGIQKGLIAYKLIRVLVSSMEEMFGDVNPLMRKKFKGIVSAKSDMNNVSKELDEIINELGYKKGKEF